MNERIQQLAEQAGLVRGGYANGTNIMTWRESFDSPGSLEKFAELLVKECARVPINMWDKAELNADIAVKIEDRIRAEFGIPGVKL